MSDDRTAEFLSLAKSGTPSTTGTNSLQGYYANPNLSSYAGGGSSSAATGPGGGASSHTPSHNNKKVNDKGAAAKNNPAYAELRTFQFTAAGISKDIAGTSALLTELTELVRHQSSILTDPHESDRINELVVRIKTNIENLNMRLDQAGNLIAQQKRRLGNQSQVGQQASNLVEELKTEFAQAASGFKKVLQQRTDTMKESGYLQRQVYGSGDGSNSNKNNKNYGDDDDDDNPIPNMSMAPPPVFGESASSSFGAGGSVNAFPTLDLTSSMMSTGEATGSSLPRPHGINYGGGGGSSHPTNPNFFLEEEEDGLGGYGYSSQNNSNTLTPLDIQRMEQESGLQTQLIPDSQYLETRADAMSAVEAHIVELGTVFNKLAGMVAEHREMVHRVEDNVDDANTNIGLSMNALTDTLTSLRSNKMLALRILAVLTVFIIIFVIFFA